ncbi:MAG: integrase arm-type DNA-binding domain-containing protein [Acidobacteriota bacterium]
MKLTKKAVDAASYDGKTWLSKSGKRTYSKCVLWDDQVPGFGLRITPGGAKSFVFNYRRDGRKRLITLGRYGVLTVDQARAAAVRHSATVLEGGDPLAERQERRGGVTVAEAFDRYFREHAETKKKPKSIQNDRLLANKHILPRIGSLKVDLVTRQDVVSPIHHRMRDTPYQANRALALLSKVFSLCELWGWRPQGSNPTRGIEKYPEKNRERYLTGDELERLAKTLAEFEAAGDDKYAVAAVRLLIFTGCRLREILHAQWQYVYLDERRLHLPDSKVGKRDILLFEPAIAVLRGLDRREGCPYVIVGRFADRPRADLNSFWRRLRRRAEIQNLQIKDLRHTFATSGVSAGEGLPIIGRLLGHSQASTTARYAHVAPSPAADAGERIAANLAAAMGGESGKPVQEGALLEAAKGMSAEELVAALLKHTRE